MSQQFTPLSVSHYGSTVAIKRRLPHSPASEQLLHDRLRDVTILEEYQAQQ